MKFQFDGSQAYQLRAIESVATLFQGQPRVGLDWSGAGPGELFGPVRNRLLLDEGQLLANLQDVQRKNALAVDDHLDCIEEEIQTTAGKIKARFPNYSAEMETGTGKTYVYTRTALELHRRYGLRKFIIVVPSVAIREGVLKSLKDTHEHLRSLYDNVPSRQGVGLSEKERAAIVDFVALNPNAGDEIKRTGGARKIRFAGKGKGKSGGFRVISFYGGADIPVFLLNVFAKNEKSDLTKAERNEFKAKLAALAAAYRGIK